MTVRLENECGLTDAELEHVRLGVKVVSRNHPLLGSNNSIGLPAGSSTRICFPPGPGTIPLRKCAPDDVNFATSDARSSVSRTSRFQPPGTGLEPSSSERDAELPGPLSHSEVATLHHRKRRTPSFHQFETKHVDVKRYGHINVGNQVTDYCHLNCPVSDFA